MKTVAELEKELAEARELEAKNSQEEIDKAGKIMQDILADKNNFQYKVTRVQNELEPYDALIVVKQVDPKIQDKFLKSREAFKAHEHYYLFENFVGSKKGICLSY